ncbi:hypothetical protein [Nocardiopsis metallicus]|uniref:Uncharacterized protein n=1 Tax=Nocardiopsis metallicus TaxID=179819 RepID=A0A840W2T3_9ACTN|nr:hypothetical protein [Nocardiopsis metallicus]MBB5489603.1 hypothetical protein [Nocardiopsis metallicus]
MTYDHRMVQTATLGGRLSYDPVFLPMERHLALEFKDRDPEATFWCGELLGGCGGQLGVKIYWEKVAHFAHHSSTNQCTRQFGGIDSADHLFAGKHVNRWLSANGLTQREPRFEGDFDTGGTCHRLTLPAIGEEPTILFEFTKHVNPGVQRLLSQGLDRPQAWFVQNNSELVQRLTRTDGHALRFRMRTEGFERRVDVGTTSPDGQTWWRPIEECSLEIEHRSSPPPMALPKPVVAPAPMPNPRARGRSREPGQILPHPRIERLRTALKQGDWKEARQSSDRLLWLLKGAKDIGITHYRGEAEELLEISRKALRHLMPRATLTVHSQERVTAPSTTPVPAPRQSQPTPKTAGIPTQPRRSKNKKQNRRRGSTSAVPAQRSELATKVDENALLKLQERFNNQRQ